MAVEAAMAMVDVVREGELRRLRICDMPDCGGVLVDLSKNRSKRYCEGSCGNRAAVAAYRARKAGIEVAAPAIQELPWVERAGRTTQRAATRRRDRG